MEASDFYRRLTKDGSIMIKDGKVVIKDGEALLDLMDEILPETWPMRQKIVFAMQVIQDVCHLTPYQAMYVWLELDKAERDIYKGIAAEMKRGGAFQPTDEEK